MARLTDSEFTKKTTLNSDDYLLVDNATQGSAAVSMESFMNKYREESHLIELNTSAGEGTVDGDLYVAIQALGWGSEVIE